MQDGFTFESGITKDEKVRILNDVRKYSLLSPMLSFGAILFDYVLIFGLVFTAVHFASAPVSAVVIFIIGSRQHALLLLMHDGAHSRLANNKKVNLYISDLLCAFPLFVTTSNYRKSHLGHHKYLNTELDPDLKMRRNKEWEFPKTKNAVALILLRQITGLNAFHILGKIYRFGVKNKTVDKKEQTPLIQKIVRLCYYLLLITGLTVFHVWPLFLLYWILPAFTVLPFLLRLRSLAEHFGLEWSHELNSSRNVTTNLFSTFFLVPHSANYHLLHHLYPSIPFYNLKKLHRSLMKNPVYSSMAVNSDGYLKLRKDSVFNALAKDDKISPII